MGREEIVQYRVFFGKDSFLIELLGDKKKLIGKLLFSEEINASGGFQKNTFFLAKSDYMFYIDLLRNEKPLGFEMLENSFRIVSMHEPSGEQEKK